MCDNIQRPITAIDVRDAIVCCFHEAHEKVLNENVDMPEDLKEKFSKNSIINILKAQFQKVGGDYENPTKETLFYVIIGLVEIAKNFRDINLIIKNFCDIIKLIDELEQ